jgi:hypothetical protein
MLTRNKLTNVIKNLCVIHEFENILWATLKDTVSMPNWPLEHFLCLAIPLQSQCTLIERLQGKKIIPHGYTGYIVSNDVGVDDAELCVMSTAPTLNNIPAGTNNIYVLVQEAPGIYPSGLYFIDKRFNKIYVSPLNFLSHEGLRKVTNKLFPESSNNVYSDIKRLSSEQLSEVTLATGHSQIQKGRIYFQSDKSSVKYTLKLPSEEIITDTVSNAVLGINQLFDENQLSKVWPEIMRVTFQRGHTHLAQNGYEIHHGLINKPEDLEAVIKEIFSDYDEAFEYFKSLKHLSKFDFSMPPVKWLEQCHSAENTIGKYDINLRPIGHKYKFNMPRSMETIILAQHFQLDVEKVMNENGVLDGTRCKIEKAAEILNVDVENVISECQKKGLGVYLQKGKFKIDRYAANPITVESINQNRKISYDYCYKGLVRLLDGTLDYFYEDDVIKCKDNDSYKMVNLQPSLGQLIQGITASHIMLRRNELIVRDDCFFIQEELIAHVTNCKEAGIINKEKLTPKTRKHLLKALMKKAYLGEMEKLKREPTAGEVWDALRAEPHVALCHPALGDVQKNQKALYDIDEIIQEMDDRELGWRNRDGKDKKILFTSFETKLSKMKSEINSPILNT